MNKNSEQDHVGSGTNSDNDNSDLRDGVISDDEDDYEVYCYAESDVESDELNDIDCDDGENGVKPGWWEDENADIQTDTFCLSILVC